MMKMKGTAFSSTVIEAVILKDQSNHIPGLDSHAVVSLCGTHEGHSHITHSLNTI